MAGVCEEECMGHYMKPLKGGSPADETLTLLRCYGCEDATAS